MRSLLCAVVLFVILIIRASAVDDTKSNTKKYLLADDIAPCNDDQSINDCLKVLFEKMLDRLKYGNEELNIPPVEPLKINRTTFNYKSGVINGRVSIKDAAVYGMSKGMIRKVDFKTDGNKIHLNLIQTTPLWYIQGNYKADFMVNNLQMKPKGTFNLTVIDSEFDINAGGQLYDKDNHRFVRLSTYDVNPKVNDIKFDATGLFQDPALNDLALNVVNQYWRQMFDLVVPQLRTYLSPILMGMLNEILSVVPFDEYVKDIKQ